MTTERVSSKTSGNVMSHTTAAVVVWWVLALPPAQPAEPRLPRAVRPLHYHLALLYDIDPATNFSFFANVDIMLMVLKSTPEIVLHAQDFIIALDSVKVSMNGTVDVEVTGVSMGSDFLTVSLGQSLSEKEYYTMSIAFYGTVKIEVDGAYVTSYIDKKTRDTEFLIATKLGPISARKAFPCFDEPALKAIFRLSIGHHRNYSAISNMPSYNQTDANALENVWPWSTVHDTFKKGLDQFVWDHFDSSLRMSTYLVAWVVSKLKNTRMKSHCRIWTRPDAIEHTEYALAIGPKLMDNYKKWFNYDILYPLPKLDMVAVPSVPDLESESWGLILNAEVALLYDQKQNSVLNKEIVANVIAHELAHQWFGNLVTMTWWSELWLYEGFAAYMASLLVAAAEPAWEADSNHAVISTLAVFNEDVLEKSRPVSVPIEDPDQIREAYASVALRKGFVLVRMSAKILGEEAFREGVKSFILKYTYNNASQDELWQELTLAKERKGGFSRNITVKTVMDTWTKQAGYPVLNVTRDYEQGKFLYIQQKRFLKEQATSSWWVPFSLLCQNDKIDKARTVDWLAAYEGTEAPQRYQHSASNQEWVLLNTDLMAPYRVNYDQSNWRMLIEKLHSTHFADVPALGRVQLVGDALALAWNDELDYATALDVVYYLHNELLYLPLKAALDGLSQIEVLLLRVSAYGIFQNFVRNLINAAYHNIGGLSLKPNSDSLKFSKMQKLISDWACRSDLDNCQEKAIELFQAWMDSENPDKHNPVPPEVRPAVYCTAIARGKVDHWNFLLARENATEVPVESEIILRALACSEEVWILSRYLEWVLAPRAELRAQDAAAAAAAGAAGAAGAAAAVFGGVARAKVGFLVAKEFFYNRIPEISHAFSRRKDIVGSFVKALASQFTMQVEIDEFVTWHQLNKNYLVGCEREVEEAVAEAKKNVMWLMKHKKTVVDIMKQRFPDYKPRAYQLTTKPPPRSTTTRNNSQSQKFGKLSVSRGTSTRIVRDIFRTSVICVLFWTSF